MIELLPDETTDIDPRYLPAFCDAAELHERCTETEPDTALVVDDDRMDLNDNMTTRPLYACRGKLLRR